jgi:hypothetical protein
MMNGYIINMLLRLLFGLLFLMVLMECIAAASDCSYSSNFLFNFVSVSMLWVCLRLMFLILFLKLLLLLIGWLGGYICSLTVPTAGLVETGLFNFEESRSPVAPPM